jgi:hypothetical protein
MHQENAQVDAQAKDINRRLCKEKKQNKGQRQLQGPVQGGKAYMMIMMSQIKHSVESGNHEEWEKMYRKVCTAVRTHKEDECEGDGNDDEDYKSVLYCEV